MTKKKKLTIATHNGKFHVDDVFAVATLVHLLGEKSVKIVRTRDPEIIEKADYVVDVGGVHDPDKERFDHHQKGGAGERDNKVPYAAFGLVWQKYGEKLCASDEVADRVDKKMVQTIDALDNGINYFDTDVISEDVYRYLIHDCVHAFIPTWKETTDVDEAFNEVLVIAKRVLEREIIIAQDELEGEDMVLKELHSRDNKEILVLDDPYPWQEIVLTDPDLLFVVYPSRGKEVWVVKGVKRNITEFDLRKYFPESWAGKRDAELQRETGVEDAIFSHNHRFIVTAHSKEGALRLAQKACLN